MNIIGYASFNPLAGIRCFLTEISDTLCRWCALFQSPSGDSLFSDDSEGGEIMYLILNLFQSPSRDSLFSDNAVWILHREFLSRVSIP